MGPCKRDSLTLCVDASELHADVAAVDALARLALLAGRYGCQISLQNASAELAELIELAGLSEVLPSQPIRRRSRGPRC
jgi:ABC-type transporter Mla MlaB component